MTAYDVPVPPEFDLRLPADPPAWRARLGDVLRAHGHVTVEQLDTALLQQQGTRNPAQWRRLGRILLDTGVIDEDQLAEALGELHGLPVVDLDRVPIDEGVARLIPQHVAERYCLIPMGWDGRTLRVAVSDPIDVVALDDVRALSGASGLAVAVAAETDVRAHLHHVWMTHDTELVAARFARDATGVTTGDVGEAPAAQMVDRMLQHAVRLGASDVHVEPDAHASQVRMRVDGVLREVLSLPIEGHPALVARLAGLTTVEPVRPGVPYDGRARVDVDDRRVDVRVAVLPSLYGDTVVVHLWPVGAEPLRLDALGLDPAQLAAFRRVLARGSGLVVVAGPAGSGRSETLHAALRAALSPELKAIAVEDATGAERVGVTQVEVDESAGRPYEAAVRTALVQRPDVLLVGELRDRATADVAARAALDGRLVLAGLPSRDAAAAMARLADLGVDRDVLAAAVSLVVGQRLLRVPCPSCAIRTRHASPIHADRLHLRAEDLAPESVVAIGCMRCHWTGYRGRTGIFEVVEAGAALRDVLLTAPGEDLARGMLARAGHVGLVRAAGRAAVQNRTTYEEAARTVAGLVDVG